MQAQLTQVVAFLLEEYLVGWDGCPHAFVITSGFTERSVSPDWALGDANRSPSYPFLIMETKVDIGGSGDSAYQGAGYFLWFWSRNRTAAAVLQATTCPCILLEVSHAAHTPATNACR